MGNATIFDTLLVGTGDFCYTVGRDITGRRERKLSPPPGRPQARRAEMRREDCGFMPDLSNIMVEAMPEGAVLIRRWRTERFNEEARLAFPGLREGGPLPEALRPMLTGEALGGTFSAGGSTYSFRRAVGEEAGEFLILFRPAPQTTLTDSQLDGLLRQLRELLGGLMVQWDGGRQGSAAQKGLHRMFRLIDNLQFLRDCAGAGELRFSPVTMDLAGLCRQTAEAAGTVLREIGVQVDWEGPASLLIPGDPELLRRMLLELIANAARSAGRGQLRLRLRAQGDRALLSLSDSGSAATRRQLAAMLEGGGGEELPLPGQGAGLGLAVVREIAALHDAAMLVEWSEGAPAVVLSFPAGAGEARTPVRGPALQRDGGLSPLLVALSDLLPPALFEQEGRD